MPSGNELSLEWIREVVANDGYDVSIESDFVRAKHDSRPNVLIKIRPELGLLTVSHFWGMKKPGFGGAGKILEALNRANSMSWISTFFRDDDGDLGVTSYVVLTNDVSAHDLRTFLERESTKFKEVLLLSGLHEYVQ